MMNNILVPQHIRNRYYFLFDFLFIAITPFLALILRVDSAAWSGIYNESLILYTLISLLVRIPLFYYFRLYRRYWLYASVEEMLAIIQAVLISSIVIASLFFLEYFLDIFTWKVLPRSVPFVESLLILIGIGGSRLSLRALASKRKPKKAEKQEQRKRVLVVGAGEAGAIIVREMRTSPRVSLDPVGFVDDNRLKVGSVIHGIPVVGTLEEIPRLVKEFHVEEVVIAMPTAPGTIIRKAVKMCEEASVPSKSVPGLYELLNGQASLSRIREVKIEDLLRREPVKIDIGKVQQMITGKRVLITGAGGSIGTEICLQIANFHPKQLVVLGHGENSLFSLSYELKKARDLIDAKQTYDVKVILADIRDRPRLETIFKRFTPQIVFHAAAHKHVPLTEQNLEDAVTTNVLGTQYLIDLSVEYQVERFVLISTDKAVNPVNILGLTKRIAEMIVRDAAKFTGRPYVSVRFGNVLGSRGSVVPLFSKQIAEGGPVTVTHPEMKRFFMTIPEAVQLVLQAATLGETGEVFVLDMGEPIKIVDLARDMIELSGYQIGRDIEITYTGLRPGEKLYEELFHDDEIPERTQHKKIFVACNQSNQSSYWLQEKITLLIEKARAGDIEETRNLLDEIVSESGMNKPLDENNEIHRLRNDSLQSGIDLSGIQ
jgi:FlaA1/EpsC-like NDP-sugar epimerase